MVSVTIVIYISQSGCQFFLPTRWPSG